MMNFIRFGRKKLWPNTCTCVAKEESNANLPRQLVPQPIDTDTSPMTVRGDRYFYPDNVNVSFDMPFNMK
jgi:hypothetical protein